MRIKQIALSIFILTGLFTIAYAQPGLAQEDAPRVLQLAPTGQERAHSVAYSPDGKMLAIGASQGIYFYDASDLELIRFIPTEAWVRAVAFSPDSSLLASGSYDSTVRIWNASDGKLWKELNGHTNWVRGLAFSADGRLLATASDDNTVRVWQVGDGTTVHLLDQGTEGVRVVAFSPDGTLLATGGPSGIIRLWGMRQGELVRELAGHTDWVRALAFSPDGELLASGAFDATVRLWRVGDGQLLVTRKEHASSVLGVTFSPDGTLLATASVDTTVRLWKLPSLEIYDLLKGHNDFVFSVAFSPDGKSLASGAVDNTVRVWAVRQEENPQASEIVSSPKNCAVCHHPHSTMAPARVIETNCAVCHQEGALVLNWCPAIPRALRKDPLNIIPVIYPEISGVPQSDPSLAIAIATPGNGEHLYTSPEVMTAIPISGQIYTGDNLEVNLPVHMEVWSGLEKIADLHSKSYQDGSFRFYVNVQAGGADPYPSMVGGHNCGECHFQAPLILPSGKLRLRVTVSAPDGKIATDERVIYVNRNGSVAIPVQVIQENGESGKNIPFHATAILYEWQGRTFTAVSNLNGEATLEVEALSQVPTTYEIFVPPVVVDGILYESIAPVQLELLPGATSAPGVTLRVRARSGQINGQVKGLDSPLQLWAIELPAGAAHTVETSAQGAFSIADLPVGDYLLVADAQTLAQRGLTVPTQEIDLFQESSAKIELVPRPLIGRSLFGTVMDEDGSLLPFAWVSVEKQAHEVDPATGGYSLWGVAEKKTTLVLTAPGYYSRAAVAENAPLDFNLTRRPEMERLSWGTGTIFLPPETGAAANGLSIAFEQGWLWGDGGAQEPLLLQANGTQIFIPAGRFALERLPGQAAWFYLFEGTAQIHLPEEVTPIEMVGGQMARIAAGEALQVVSYDPVVTQAMRLGGESPVALHWQASVGEQFRNRLALIGISVAQVMTFITYSLMIVVTVGIPLLGLYLWGKRRSKRAA